jgi:hypothetical protein
MYIIHTVHVQVDDVMFLLLISDLLRFPSLSAVSIFCYLALLWLGGVFVVWTGLLICCDGIPRIATRVRDREAGIEEGDTRLCRSLATAEEHPAGIVKATTTTTTTTARTDERLLY